MRARLHKGPRKLQRLKILRLGAKVLQKFGVNDYLNGPESLLHDIGDKNNLMGFRDMRKDPKWSLGRTEGSLVDLHSWLLTTCMMEPHGTLLICRQGNAMGPRCIEVKNPESSNECGGIPSVFPSTLLLIHSIV